MFVLFQQSARLGTQSRSVTHIQTHTSPYHNYNIHTHTYVYACPEVGAIGDTVWASGTHTHTHTHHHITTTTHTHTCIPVQQWAQLGTQSGQVCPGKPCILL